MRAIHWLALGAAMSVGTVQAASSEVTMNQVSSDGVGEFVGQITINETEHGLVFTPKLNSLPAGIHGFHVHETGNCEPAMSEGENVAAKSAGGHFDPDDKGEHDGPYGQGHLGDLPALYVGDDGNAHYPVLAPRIKTLEEIKGRALMIHAGGDNHSDEPQPLGGGGKRIACGVI
ncbi:MULTISPECIES: superoxide dismutase family protein [Pseudomonas]|uniref:superoxide dismutase family protein n=1 Tax=Pseudomonas TaxID=286 RepID=UPI00123A5D0F|nr:MULTISPECIES: superoxide dismutase family protein [Pseudomonas]QIB50622.1 superoxide dismutase [Cu-Zn] SodC2 [Pseudomonas sp. OIL-1]